MKTLTLEDMRQLRTMTRAERQAHSCRESRLDGLNLDGLDLSGLDFSWSDFRHVSFVGACLQDTDLSDTLFTDCSLAGADLAGADLHGAALRGCDLNHAVIKGANLYRANLEGARLDGIVDDEKTRFFRLYCPQKGPFLAYKKCFNDLLVTLLVPADAKRTSATGKTCRCNKAKVLSIKSFDGKTSYKEAMSLVDPKFIYRVGQWMEVKNFNEDRWYDSTTGIHFWLTPEEAKAY